MHSGIQSWKNLVVYALNAFSIPLLLKTLFSPWENDRTAGPKFGFIERIAFAIISRVIGFIARIIYISIGLIFTLIAVLTFPLFLLFPIKISTEYLENLSSFGSFLSYGSTYTLSKHGRDVFAPPSLRLYGKEKALRMIERGLSKDTNRNILLVGEPGVGKSAVVSKLGRLGKSGLSFSGIRNHRVVELPLEGLDFNDFEKAMTESADAGNVIVVIENIHEHPELYNKIIPYLGMPKLGIIATTNFSGHDKVLKNYPEFLSKFEKVEITPTNTEETLAILNNNAILNNISVEQGALEEIVNLSDRFISNQTQPIKSLLVLEELQSLRKKISVEDVRQIVSDKTNMPIGMINTDEKKLLINLETTMKNKIIGQTEAVKEVSEALRRLRTGITDPSKPAGSFLFLGPTGVGKTYTAKILAESYFGHKKAMINFDMSEFSLPDSVSLFSDRLAGVIEENPLSLVFFDELEKAHESIRHLLLQVLDEARLTRENGRIASFKDSIIIATSNAGSSDIIDNPSIDKKTLIDNLIREKVFAPEFLNRFSGIVLFKPLLQEEARQVAKLTLTEFSNRLFEDKKIKLLITDALIDKVTSIGFDPKFGARPIKRAIEELVENKVADYIMNGGIEGELKIL